MLAQEKRLLVIRVTEKMWGEQVSGKDEFHLGESEVCSVSTKAMMGLPI